MQVQDAHALELAASSATEAHLIAEGCYGQANGQRLVAQLVRPSVIRHQHRMLEEDSVGALAQHAARPPEGDERGEGCGRDDRVEDVRVRGVVEDH